jgi:hypothetical protein
MGTLARSGLGERLSEAYRMGPGEAGDDLDKPAGEAYARLTAAMKRGRLLGVVCGLALVGAGLVAHAAAAQSRPRLLVPVGTISLPPSLSGGTFGGVATDAAGNVYAGVIRGLLTHVAVFDREGRFLRSWRADSFSALRLSDPVLAVGPDGLVYVAPQERDFTPRDESVRVFRPDGTPVRTFGAGSGLNEVSDIEVDQAGNVYLASRAVPEVGIRDDVIVKFNPAGEVTARFAPVPAKPGQFGTSLRGLALAPDGSIYAATDVSDQLFVHLDQTGRRIPGIDASFIIPGSNKHFRDVDFANGNYYIAGDFHGLRGASPLGVAVISPAGRLNDLVSGEGGEIAVTGSDIYVTKLHALRPPASAREPASHIAGELGHASFQEFRPAGEGVGKGHGTGSDSCRSIPTSRDAATGIVTVSVPRSGDRCGVFFTNRGNPCPSGYDPVGNPQAYNDGRPIAGAVYYPQVHFSEIMIPNGQFSSGPVVFEWTCRSLTQFPPDRNAYEWKGNIALVDPSGTVVDTQTRRPVEGATVQLEFALRRGSPFGTPSVSGFSPQVNPQATSRSGSFGWDVAPGLWRLRITAFGYRPLTSPIYAVPPERKNLRLGLRPNPAQQARIIDPFAGRVGRTRLGSRAGKRGIAGLRLRVLRGRIRGISVRSRSYRTPMGVSLGSGEAKLWDAYPREISQTMLRSRSKPSSFRVGKATFRVRGKRVTAITLGR